MGAFSLNSRTGLAFLALVVISVLFALSRMPGGIGGTGITGAPGGIGGTGIYGRIDAFGSIWVNGVEIFYDEDQNVMRQGRDGLPDRLAIGQMVAVTIDDETGRAEARTIEIIEEVSGPVTSANEEQIEILGQLVLLTDDTIVDLPNGSFAGVESLAIGGYRTQDGEIIASHISAPLIADEATLRGKIDRVETDAFWIEDQKIARPRHLYNVGEHVEIRGVVEQYENNEPELRAEKIKRRGLLPFDELPKELLYQSLNNHSEYYSGLPAVQFDRTHTPPDAPYYTEVRHVHVISAETEIVDGINWIKRVEPRESLKRDSSRIVSGIRAQRASDIIRERRGLLPREEFEAEQRRRFEIAQERLNAGNPEGVVVEPDQAPSPGVVQEIIESLDQSGFQDRVQAQNPDVAENLQERRAVFQERRQAEMETRRAALLENELARERLRERIEARRKELQAARLQAANQRRLIAVEARRQALIEARRQALQEAKPDPEDLFEAQEVERLIRDGNIDRETFREIQRNIRERVQSEIRDGARLEAREEIRNRIRAEIRRRIRRQLREQ